MMEIKTTTKDDQTYHNIDIRDLDKSESAVLKVLGEPSEFVGRFGPSYRFDCEYNNQVVGLWITPTMKSTPGFKVSVKDALIKNVGKNVVITREKVWQTVNEDGTTDGFNLWRIEEEKEE